MNHLPLLLAVLVVIAAGLVLVAGGRDEDEHAESAPPAPPGDGPTQPDVAPPAAPEPEELEPPPEALRPDGTQVDLSRRFDTYELEDVPLAKALEEVGRRLECEVRYSAEAWGRVETSMLSVQLADVGAPTVLNLLTEPYGVVYRVHRGVLWILTPGEELPEHAR